MSKKININYRKICQEYYQYSKESMIGMDVHHVDGNRNNNDPSNLMLISPEEHAKLHTNDFVLWARIGSKMGNEAFVKRLNEYGPTDKEKSHRLKLSEMCKKGLHRIPHSEQSKKIISEKKKELLKNKSNHPLWGKTTYKVTSPEGEEFIVSGGWKDWCFERGLNSSNLTLVAKGIRKHHKGWIAEFLDD